MSWHNVLCAAMTIPGSYCDCNPDFDKSLLAENIGVNAADIEILEVNSEVGPVDSNSDERCWWVIYALHTDLKPIVHEALVFAPDVEQ